MITLPDSDTQIATAPAETEFASGRFAIGGGRFLSWQADKPPPPAAIRGTVLIFNDWSMAFDSDKALLAALAARGFYTAGYDWYRQGSLPPKAKAGKIVKRKVEQERYACRFNSHALACFLQTVLLPEYPAPFYVLAQGLGALFVLSAQNILRSAVSRMILIAPPMTIHGHAPNSFYHFGIKASSLLTRQSKKRKNTAQNSLAYKANLLDHAAYIFSGAFCKSMTIPCLIISAGRDRKANIAQARLLTERLRFADNLIIPAASPALLQDSAWQRNQFWAAFDAFIPGSDAIIANNILEHAVLL